MRRPHSHENPVLRSLPRAGALLALCLGIISCSENSVVASPIASVTLYTRESDSARVPESTSVFQTGDRVRALVRLAPAALDQAIVWHIQWLLPNGKRRFKKKIVQMPGESNPVLRSAIRLREKHGAGEYVLQIFRFRFLVYQKEFMVHVNTQSRL